MLVKGAPITEQELGAMKQVTLGLGQLSITLEWGSDPQIKAFDLFLQIARVLGCQTDFEDEGFMKATTKDMINHVLHALGIATIV